MALYKYDVYVTKTDDAAFDLLYKPGQVPPHSGVYRCHGCGREVVGEHERTLPPQNHHQHATSQGEVQWRMVAFADHRPK